MFYICLIVFSINILFLFFYEKRIITPNNSSATPTIYISLQEKDRPFAEHLKNYLGYGSIQLEATSPNAIRFVIRNKEGIIDILNLINGYFRTPKISKLHAMIDWVNTKPGYLLKPIAKLPLDTSQLNTNSWLAGFAVMVVSKYN